MYMEFWLRRLTIVVCLLIFIFGVYVYIEDISFDVFLKIAEENKVLGAFIFSCIMFGTTVIAPLTSLPLVPVVAMLIGPLATGIACFIGWTGGAIVAFLLGRYYGRPLLKKFMNLESIQKYEAYIRPDTGFILIVALRMVLPVDLLSYALGLFSTVSLKIYTLGTMIGIAWFSFAFAYMGEALMKRDYVLLTIISVASVLILFVSWRYSRKYIK